MPYYYGFDWTYLVIVLPCILLSLWASASVKSTFNRYSKQLSYRRRRCPAGPQCQWCSRCADPACCR